MTHFISGLLPSVENDNNNIINIVKRSQEFNTTSSKYGETIHRNELVTLSYAGYFTIAFMLTLAFGLGIVLNCMSLYVFANFKHLSSPINILIICLNLCDFLMCVIGTPLAMSSAWNHRWLWGDDMCRFEGFTVFFLGLTSVYLLMAISIERYIAISNPQLSQRVTRKVAVLCCLACIAGALLWAILPLGGWNDYGLEAAGISCSVVWESTDPSYMAYIYTILFFCLVFPVSLMVYCYCGILKALQSLKNMSATDRRQRISEKNLDMERKMVKTSAIIIASVMFCWTPYAIVSVMTSFGGHHLIHPFAATVPPVIAKMQVVSHKAFQKAFRLTFDPRLKRTTRTDEPVIPSQNEGPETNEATPDKTLAVLA